MSVGANSRRAAYLKSALRYWLKRVRDKIKNRPELGFMNYDGYPSHGSE